MNVVFRPRPNSPPAKNKTVLKFGESPNSEYICFLSNFSENLVETGIPVINIFSESIYMF